MSKIIIIFFILNSYNIALSSIKENIISKLKQTNNLSFNFVQTIKNENENGNCIIEYPKKIYCEYKNIDQKIIVSNGKTLVIKNINNENYYIYPLKKTPLEFLLDRNYLVSKIKYLEPKIIDNKFLAFSIFGNNNNEIKIFFNKDSLILTGWQTEDIYQNLSITFISSVEINQEIDDRIFLLPKK